MEKWDLNGRVAVVTGATDGIGKVTARRLAAMGASVVMVGRNPEKTERARADILKDHPEAILETQIADLSSLAEIEALAAAIGERHAHLHILVNNAGAMFTTRTLSVDGFEMTFALNHLSYFALTLRLLDRLKAGGPARIVNVSSVAHRRVTLDFDDLQMERRYRAFLAYGRSKLCNLYFTFALARRLDKHAVTVNALHPGFVASAFGNNNRAPMLRTALGLAKALAAVTPEKGARTSLYLAAAPDIEGVSGEYFEKCRIARPSPEARLADASERLWAASATMTGLG
ncbi:MAG: SDR family oxidoreductase [Alphaproteobacteria bacterium]